MADIAPKSLYNIMQVLNLAEDKPYSGVVPREPGDDSTMEIGNTNGRCMSFVRNMVALPTHSDYGPRRPNVIRRSDMPVHVRRSPQKPAIVPVLTLRIPLSATCVCSWRRRDLLHEDRRNILLMLHVGYTVAWNRSEHHVEECGGC